MTLNVGDVYIVTYVKALFEMNALEYITLEAGDKVIVANITYHQNSIGIELMRNGYDELKIFMPYHVAEGLFEKI
jgi:hypothetical protein